MHLPGHFESPIVCGAALAAGAAVVTYAFVKIKNAGPRARKTPAAGSGRPGKAAQKAVKTTEY